VSADTIVEADMKVYGYWMKRKSSASSSRKSNRPIGVTSFAALHTAPEKTELDRAIDPKPYVNGYPDGTFRQDAPVTRAKAAALMNRAVMRILDRLLQGLVRLRNNSRDGNLDFRQDF
jgi:hypothetical protein